MGQRSIRFPDELDARLVAAAGADGRSFSNFVVRTLEKALGAEEHAPERAVPAPPRTPAPMKPAAGELPKIARRHWGK